MRVLWITNVLLPPICEVMKAKAPLSCGWLYSSAKSLLKYDDDLKMGVATVYPTSSLIHKEIDNVDYYLLPSTGNNQKYDKKLVPIWKKLYSDFKPDVVHIHGTECAHGLAFMRACPDAKVVVSIQGLVSVIERYYMHGISIKDALMSITPRCLIKGENLWKEQKSYYYRGQIEKEILRNCKYVIGRTSWDKAHSWAINHNVRYFFCNESLRDSFYINSWDYSKCEPHSIFISQAGYPIKGVHQLLKAMPLILEIYPDSKIYIAGRNIIDDDTFMKRFKMLSYAKYLRKLIKKNGLERHVFFTGGLNEEKMCEQYLKSNVFVSCSSLENSPNSLGEAQLLGVPCISSYVGGAMDMMEGAEEYMYRFDEFEMLAYKICKIFDLKDKADFSALSHSAAKRFDRIENTKQLISIYSSIHNS